MHPPRAVPYLGVRGQNQTEIFSDHDKTSLSTAAVSDLSVAKNVKQKWRQGRNYVP